MNRLLLALLTLWLSSCLAGCVASSATNPGLRNRLIPQHLSVDETWREPAYDPSERASDRDLGPFVVVGYGFPRESERVLKIFTLGRDLDHLYGFLQLNGVSLVRTGTGNATMVDSAELRNALEAYLQILVQRLDVCVSNIVNIDTGVVSSTDPTPYRRKVFVLHDDGTTTVESDPSPFLHEWAPAHPYAIKTGDRQGYVLHPNVDPIVEGIELESIAAEHRIIRDALGALFDRTYRHQ